MAEAIHKEENGTIDVAVVKIPFDNMPSDGITVSDADLTAYANTHKHEYDREEVLGSLKLEARSVNGEF